MYLLYDNFLFFSHNNHNNNDMYSEVSMYGAAEPRDDD